MAVKWSVIDQEFPECMPIGGMGLEKTKINFFYVLFLLYKYPIHV